MVAVAVLNLTISLSIYFHERHFVQSASRTVGTVTKMIERPGHDSSTVYSPVYTFQDAQGKQHEIYSSSGTYPPAYKVGDNVTVLYPPDNPDKAETDSFLDKWLSAALFGIFGFIALIFGIGLFLVVALITRYEV